MHHYPDASAVVRALSPDEPVILNRPHAAARAARFFTEKFPGKSLYAVKANPSPWVIRAQAANGVSAFDVASVPEIELVRAHAPDARPCPAGRKRPGSPRMAPAGPSGRSHTSGHHSGRESKSAAWPRSLQAGHRTVGAAPARRRGPDSSSTLVGEVFSLAE